MAKVQIPVAVRQAPMSDGVERELEKRILSGQWVEGFKLPSEGKLCTEFGVSRTAVREALRELRGRGIIETVNGSGSYVAGGNMEMVSRAMSAYSSMVVDEKAAEDLIEFRILIEGAAVQRLAYNTESNDADVQRLSGILEQMKEVNDSPEQFGKLDSKFHITILETCKNAFISMIGKALYTHYVHCIGDAHALADESMRVDTVNEHAAIVEAVKAGDGDAARKALESHLDSASTRGKSLEAKK